MATRVSPGGGAGFVPKILQSSSITLNVGTITSAKMLINYTGTLKVALTADGGSHWEEVTISSGTETTHTFTNTGNDLRYRIVGENGAQVTYVTLEPTIE